MKIGFYLILLIALMQCSLLTIGQTISTVAGNGLLGYNGDGIPATSAKLHLPSKVIIDFDGNLIIADSWGHRVRKVNAVTGYISTIAGTGVAGFNGDNIPATIAELNNPIGLAVDSTGNLFIGDCNNQRVRKVNMSTGIITTFAGNGFGAGTIGAYSGDGGPATNAELNGPAYIAMDHKGYLFISDCKNYRVRKVSIITDTIITVAGRGVWGYSGDGYNATSAEFNMLTGIGTDAEGNLFICDTNSTIRKVSATTGIISTVAGNRISGYLGDGGQATSAEISNPYDVSIDPSGKFYIAEFKGRVRVVDTFGVIQTAAGTTVFGYNGDGIPATSAMMNEVTGVANDVCGNLYIADASNERVRKIEFNPLCGNLVVNDFYPETNIKIKPNPAISTLKIDNLKTTTQYQLYNMLGTTIMQGILKPGNNTLSMDALEPGIYMLALIDEKVEKTVHKIVKQ